MPTNSNSAKFNQLLDKYARYYSNYVQVNMMIQHPLDEEWFPLETFMEVGVELGAKLHMMRKEIREMVNG